MAFWEEAWLGDEGCPKVCVGVFGIQQPSGATQWNDSAPSDEESSHRQALDKAIPGNVCLVVVLFCSLSELTISVPGSLLSENVPGVNYQNAASVMAQISDSWWLEHESFKYMLTIFVHEDNKDISSNPTTLPAGGTQKDMRKQRQVELKDESATGQRLTAPWRKVWGCRSSD